MSDVQIIMGMKKDRFRAQIRRNHQEQQFSLKRVINKEASGSAEFELISQSLIKDVVKMSTIITNDDDLMQRILASKDYAAQLIMCNLCASSSDKVISVLVNQYKIHEVLVFLEVDTSIHGLNLLLHSQRKYLLEPVKYLIKLEYHLNSNDEQLLSQLIILVDHFNIQLNYDILIILLNKAFHFKNLKHKSIVIFILLNLLKTNIDVELTYIFEFIEQMKMENNFALPMLSLSLIFNYIPIKFTIAILEISQLQEMLIYILEFGELESKESSLDVQTFIIQLLYRLAAFDNSTINQFLEEIYPDIFDMVKETKSEDVFLFGCRVIVSICSNSEILDVHSMVDLLFQKIRCGTFNNQEMLKLLSLIATEFSISLDEYQKQLIMESNHEAVDQSVMILLNSLI